VIFFDFVEKRHKCDAHPPPHKGGTNFPLAFLHNFHKGGGRTIMAIRAFKHGQGKDCYLSKIE
jgi:hypothetical protein